MTSGSTPARSAADTRQAPHRPPADEIAEDMRHGRYPDGQEALDYGLIDEIRASRGQ
jgi:ATP-dependent protease ClpP protease subunit